MQRPDAVGAYAVVPVRFVSVVFKAVEVGGDEEEALLVYACPGISVFVLYEMMNL
jgi:hypothetical protein